MKHVVPRLSVAMILIIAPEAFAQRPCDPLIDGTYCAEQMPARGVWRPGSAGSFGSMRSGLGESLTTTPPATLGAITFGSGRTCIGLLRRGFCS